MNVIMAPHPDDEIIGCFEILKKGNCVVNFTTKLNKERAEECLNLRNHFDVKFIYFQYSVPPAFLSIKNTFYFPHPIYETHPEHRLLGQHGERLLRNGYNVIFYSTIMNAPFIFETPFSEEKKKVLNLLYPSQKSLWEYDYKYFLFSGYDKWLIELGNENG